MNLLKLFIYKFRHSYLLIIFYLGFVSGAQAQVYAPGQGYTTISAREMQISQTQALMNYLAQNLAARMMDDDLDGEPEADRAAVNDEDGNKLTGIPSTRGSPTTNATLDKGNHTRDVWGGRIRYCAWNNGTANAFSRRGWLAGSAVAGVYFVLISAGPDGVFSQTCESVWSGSGDPNTRSISDDIHVIYTKERLAFNATAQAFRTAVASRNDFVSLASAHRLASQNGTFENRLGADEVRLLRFENGAAGWERRLYVRMDGRASTANIGAEGFDPLTPMVDLYGNLIGGGNPTSSLTIRSNFNEFNTSAVNTGRIEFQTSSLGLASNNYFTRLSIDQFGNINTMSNDISSALVSGFSQGFAVGNKIAFGTQDFTPGTNLASNASTLRSFGVLTNISTNARAAAILSLATVNRNIYRGWDFVSASQGQFYLQPIGVNGNYMGIASSGNIANGGAFLFYANGTSNAAVFQTNQNTSSIRLEASGGKFLDMVYDNLASKFSIGMNGQDPLFVLDNTNGDNGIAGFNLNTIQLKDGIQIVASKNTLSFYTQPNNQALKISNNNIDTYNRDFRITQDGLIKLTLASTGRIIFQDQSSLYSNTSTLNYTGKSFKLGDATLTNDSNLNLTLIGGGFTASTLKTDSITTSIINLAGIASISTVSNAINPFDLKYQGSNVIRVYRDTIDSYPVMQLGGVNGAANVPISITRDKGANGIGWLDFAGNMIQFRDKNNSAVRAGFIINEGSTITKLHLGNQDRALEYNSNYPELLNFTGKSFKLGDATLTNDSKINLTLIDGGFTASTLTTSIINLGGIASISTVSNAINPFDLKYQGSNVISVYRDTIDSYPVMQLGGVNGAANVPISITRDKGANGIGWLDFAGNMIQFRDKNNSAVRAGFIINEGSTITKLHLGKQDRALEYNSNDPDVLKWGGNIIKWGGNVSNNVSFSLHPTKPEATVSAQLFSFENPNHNSTLGYSPRAFFNLIDPNYTDLTFGSWDHRDNKTLRASTDPNITTLKWNNRNLINESHGSLLAGRMGLWCLDPNNPAAEDCSVVVYGDTNAPKNAVEVRQYNYQATSPHLVTGDVVSANLVNIAFNVQGNALATEFMVPSDRRLKQSIHALRPEASYTELFRKINPVSWQWKKDGSHGIGFIAQELIGAGLGDLVKVINNPDLKEEMDANGIKSPAGKQFIVDYDGMTAFLAGAQIESIKRLDRIEKLMNAGVSSELRKAMETQSLLLNTQGKDLLAAMSRVEALEKSLAKVQTQSAATDARFNELGIALDGQKKSHEKFQLEIDSLTKDVQKWEDKLKESRGKVDKFMLFFETAFDADALKDKARLVVKVPEMKVNNLTAERIEAAAIRTQMLEAEAARIKQLEADQITAQDAKLARVYSGSKEVQSLDSTVLFELPSDGQHFVVTVSGPGVYYTATVIRVDGVTHVTPLSASPNLQNPDIQLIGDGPRLRVNAAGRAVKASWVRMG